MRLRCTISSSWPAGKCGEFCSVSRHKSVCQAARKTSRAATGKAIRTNPVRYSPVAAFPLFGFLHQIALPLRKLHIPNVQLLQTPVIQKCLKLFSQNPQRPHIQNQRGCRKRHRFRQCGNMQYRPVQPNQFPKLPGEPLRLNRCDQINHRHRKAVPRIPNPFLLRRKPKPAFLRISSTTGTPHFVMVTREPASARFINSASLFFVCATS